MDVQVLFDRIVRPNLEYMHCSNHVSVPFHRKCSSYIGRLKLQSTTMRVTPRYYRVGMTTVSHGELAWR